MEGPLVWLVLSQARGVGRARLASLMKVCPDPADAWHLTVEEFRTIGFGPRTVAELVAVRRNPAVLRAAEQEWERAWKAGLRLVALYDPDYPLRLRETTAPPPYFYQAGPWKPDAHLLLAVVGTRRPTGYGQGVARRFARELAEAGVVIVSGMARGIDCAAHQGALDAGGATVAVLGGGADVCYPRDAWPLYQKIRETGAVISEQPPGAEPRREHFPERNRIISGLADAVLVVEAGDKSGTLITVDSALLDGRDVFAVPGSVHSPMSAGPHRLIRAGAMLVSSPVEILESLKPCLGLGEKPTPSLRAVRALPSGISPDEERVYRWMGAEPRWAGDLAEACGLTAGQVQGILTLLELKGLARQLPGGQYERVG